MFCRIARKEIVEHLLSFRFGLAAALCLLVVAISFLGVWRQYQTRAQDFALCQAREGEAMVSIPPTSMSLFAWGLEDVTGRTVDYRYPPFAMVLGLRPPLNPFESFFPTMDLSYVVRVIGALIALVFGFDAVCREARGGTFALMLAAGASRLSILGGKLLGGSTVVAVLFGLPVVIGLIALHLIADGAPGVEDLPRILLWGGVSLTYLVCFYCVGLLVSAAVSTPRASLLVCLILWTVFSFVLPTAVTSLTRLATDLQSPVRFMQENLYSARLAEARGEDAAAQMSQRAQARAVEIVDFTRLTLAILRLLPGPAYTDLTANIAGTGVTEVSRYFEALQRYEQAVVEARRSRGSTPGFAFARSQLSASLGASLSGLLGLLAWCAVAVWLATEALLRYDVRIREVQQL